MKPKIAALVPMRHSSERIPEKNYRLFNGRPLYHYIINTLIEVPEISEIIIDTDSQFIMEEAAKYFPKVRIIERPLHLRPGEVAMNEVLLHDLSQIDADWYLQTHSTNPLIRSETITRSIEMLIENLPDYDSLFSVNRVQSRFWDAKGQPVNHDSDMLLRTQDLPPIFEENSNIYIFNRETFNERRNRIGFCPLMFEIDRLESLDIDEEIDFTMAEILYKLIQKV